ncbi:MAG TPA: penicillin-binding transpeptidase domain-containing protein [Actinomycetota bacterium]|nr:penicillin-binding transpeptidase domain-containing protein [Actinomycetota bacterium]
MDRQIRRLGIAFVVLFSVLFAQVAYVQVFAANRIADNDANAARKIRAQYSVQRGEILASDNLTVLARSVPNPDTASPFRYLREYPQGELYGQLTGYYSRLYGLSGLEDAMDPYLAGTAPEFAAQNLTDLILGRPKQGGTVVTTLVPRLQRVAKQALGSLTGAVVALDPRSGDVLAMYSTPGFDPNRLSSGTTDQMTAAWNQLNADPQKPLLSKAFQELYLPGSTFKLVTASAALANGWAPTKTWPNPHVLDLPGSHSTLENFGNELCAGGARFVTMAEAFTESCNVTFGIIGLALGAEKLSKQARAYGYCPTDPDASPDCIEPTIPFLLPWASGRFPVPDYFSDKRSKVATSAVGLDNDLQNPLQLALVSSAIADGGTMFAPRLVTEVRDSSGLPVRSFAPAVEGHPISTATAAAMRAMMVDVVERGTGTAAQISGVTIAGKTGTATNGDNVPPNAWFTAFGPAGPTQTPRIAVAVIVLDGGSLGNEATGGRVAAPVAKQVIEAFLGR